MIQFRSWIIAAAVLIVPVAAAAQDAAPTPVQPSTAQDTTAPSPTGEVPEWSRRCNDGTCHVTRGLTETSSGKQFLTLSLVLRKGQDGATMITIIPLGIAVDQGVTIGGGRDFRTLPIATCTPEGCIAEAAFDPISLDLFASQSDVTVSFLPYQGDEKLDVLLPLAGLQEALMAARAELND